MKKMIYKLNKNFTSKIFYFCLQVEFSFKIIDNFNEYKKKISNKKYIIIITVWWKIWKLIKKFFVQKIYKIMKF